MQGKEDKVVPPNQAEDMYKGLKEQDFLPSQTLFTVTEPLITVQSHKRDTC